MAREGAVAPAAALTRATGRMSEQRRLGQRRLGQRRLGQRRLGQRAAARQGRAEGRAEGPPAVATVGAAPIGRLRRGGGPTERRRWRMRSGTSFRARLPSSPRRRSDRARPDRRGHVAVAAPPLPPRTQRNRTRPRPCPRRPQTLSFGDATPVRTRMQPPCVRLGKPTAPPPRSRCGSRSRVRAATRRYHSGAVAVLVRSDGSLLTRWPGGAVAVSVDLVGEPPPPSKPATKAPRDVDRAPPRFEMKAYYRKGGLAASIDAGAASCAEAPPRQRAPTWALPHGHSCGYAAML